MLKACIKASQNSRYIKISKCYEYCGSTFSLSFPYYPSSLLYIFFNGKIYINTKRRNRSTTNTTRAVKRRSSKPPQGRKPQTPHESPEEHPKTLQWEQTTKEKNYTKKVENNRQQHTKQQKDKEDILKATPERVGKKTHPTPQATPGKPTATKPYRFQHRTGCTFHSYRARTSRAFSQ